MDHIVLYLSYSILLYNIYLLSQAADLYRLLQRLVTSLFPNDFSIPDTNDNDSNTSNTSGNTMNERKINFFMNSDFCHLDKNVHSNRETLLSACSNRCPILISLTLN